MLLVLVSSFEATGADLAHLTTQVIGLTSQPTHSAKKSKFSTQRGAMEISSSPNSHQPKKEPGDRRYAALTTEELKLTLSGT